MGRKDGRGGAVTCVDTMCAAWIFAVGGGATFEKPVVRGQETEVRVGGDARRRPP